MSLVVKQLRELVRDGVREAMADGMQAAYEHGYNVGRREAPVDALSYRRGYMAGYSARRRGVGEGEPITGPKIRRAA